MQVKSSYEAILPPPIKIHWFWGVIAILAFFGSGMLLNYYGEASYLITRTFVVLSVCLWPILYSIIANKFNKMYTLYIKKMFEWSESESDNWYKNIAQRAFCLKGKNLAITCILWCFGIFTVYSLPLPFKTDIINNIGRLGLVALLFTGVHSIPMIFYCVKALYELTKREIKESFYADGYELLQSIKKFYMGFAVTITTINLSLYFGFLYSPYGFDELLVIWIGFISLWPTTMYISTQYYIKMIENNSKKVYLDLLNEHVIIPSLNELIANHQTDDFDNVKRNLEFRNYLIKFGGAKKDLTSAVTLITTILVGIFQIVVTVLS